jgi:hypothetical protein
MKTQECGLCIVHYTGLNDHRPESSVYLIFCMQPTLFQSFLVWRPFQMISNILSVWIILHSVNSMSTDLLTITYLKFCHNSVSTY